MIDSVVYRTDLAQVNWQEMKTTFSKDKFDNGRSPQQLQVSFENSAASVIAYRDNRIIGTARALSDGVCNAYIIDVWTLTQYRRQGIATAMMNNLLSRFQGQHVYLFTDDSVEFYQKLGFAAQDVGMGKVVGNWLQQ